MKHTKTKLLLMLMALMGLTACRSQIELMYGVPYEEYDENASQKAPGMAGTVPTNEKTQ